MTARDCAARFFVFAVCFVPYVGISAANGADIKAGDMAVAAARAEIMQGKEKVATVEAGTELTVTKVSGDWAGIKADIGGKEVSGWIRLSALKLKSPEYPHELALATLPAYVIEPPDILLIEVAKLVPLPPYRAEPFDVLTVRATGTLIDFPIDGFFLLDSEGKIDLGPVYGEVRVSGMTLPEIKKAVLEQLNIHLNKPSVSVQVAKLAATQAVAGTYLVTPDGTVNLRRYGSVQVTGKTLAEARLAIEKQLAKYFDSPEVSLEVSAFNSKCFYVIVEQADSSTSVIRLPITGKETVLDAISQAGGIPAGSGGNIRLVRPTPSGSNKEISLTVDWGAIVYRGGTATNYQLMPGDRLLIMK